MGLRERRLEMGHSQESLAQVVGVDRTTIGRWERRLVLVQPSLRPRLAESLKLDLAGLDALLKQPATLHEGATRIPPGNDCGSGGTEMIRREFLRVIAVTGALVASSAEEAEELAEGAGRGTSVGFHRMNGHLWQVYQLARAKQSVFPAVQEQIAALTDALKGRSDAEVVPLCAAAGDAFQLAGELAFDRNDYEGAAASYALAATACRDSGAFDLWACALVRHAYVDVYERRYGEAEKTLAAAAKVAKRGDSAMATRHWVSSVQAEVHAGLGDFGACERALDEAEKVVDLVGSGCDGGWLRFDGSRLAEERGARYVQLGRLDLAETALEEALKQLSLTPRQSYRRRGAVLTDLAAIGAKRRDPDQVLTFGGEAVRLARTSSSGYVARRLHGLREGLAPMAGDDRIIALEAEIGALSTH
ncbi:helix-turn-helix transcriptional regulator [Streptomyces noursei]|uniref:helix-turn-helix transcriptional regulator n=1 Tax=Streptomyces noursei TaxID=1971 RepID=UPI0035DC679B